MKKLLEVWMYRNGNSKNTEIINKKFQLPGKSDNTFIFRGFNEKARKTPFIGQAEGTETLYRFSALDIERAKFI